MQVDITAQNEVRSDLEGRDRVVPRGERSHQPQGDRGFASPAVGAGDDDALNSRRLVRVCVIGFVAIAFFR